MSCRGLGGAAQDESGPSRMGRSRVRIEDQEKGDARDEEPDASEYLWRSCDDDSSRCF
jgi:hypothetical protein